jgi:hypothetical protein
MGLMEGTNALRGTRGWTGLAAACAAALGALAIAPAALADDTMPASPVPVVADVPAVENADAAISAGDVADAMSDAGTAVSAALSESGIGADSGDITSESRDTAADIAQSPANTPESAANTPANTGDARTPATPSSVGVQTGAANVNVSIRVDSPGNDGAVSQSNTAAAGAPTGTASALPAASATSSTASSPLSAPARDNMSQSVPATPAGATAAAGTWNWTWDCASPPTIDAPALLDADGQAVPWNWRWIWNCGGNTQSATSPNSQYQPATGSETTTQYQPSNINISIRINSPGDNGPVNQTNVAISVAASGAQAGVSAGASSSEVEVHVDVQLSPSSEGEPADSSIQADAAIASQFQAIGFALETWPAPFGLTLTMARDGSFVLVPCRCGQPNNLERAWLPVGPCGELQRELHRTRGSMRRDDDWFERCFDAPLTVTPCRCLPPGTPLATADTSGVGWNGSNKGSTTRSGTAARPRTQAKHGRTLPLNRPPLPVGVMGAALGPAPAGSSSGTALPASLLIPIAVALLDLCRRVAVAKVVWPAGRRGGTFDPPG